jgi:CheY-like chemotaxis protein
VEIEVTDTGIGMEKDFLPSLFDPFTQEDGGHARRFGGTGLGMNISQKLVRLMGGEISVASEKHRGTAVRVRLPLERRTRSIAVARPAAEPGTLRGRRILVAEDNEMNAAVVRTMLAKEGAEVVLVGNGKQLVAEVAGGGFDLVISDLEMPIMGGIEAVRWIRANLPRGLRVIALTANVLPAEKQRSLDAGFDDVIHKPFRRDVLVGACRAQLARDQEPEASSNGGESPAPYDLSEIRELLDGDEVELGRVIRMFLDETPGKLAEILRAMETGDAGEVRRIVHYLETTIRHLGIGSVNEALGAIRGDGGPVDTADLEPAVRTLVAVVQAAMRGLEADFPAAGR